MEKKLIKISDEGLCEVELKKPASIIRKQAFKEKNKLPYWAVIVTF